MPFLQLLEPAGKAEEKRPVYLIHLDPCRNIQMFRVIKLGHFIILRGRDVVIIQDPYGRCLHHPFHEQHDREQHSHLDRYSQIHHDCQEECYKKDCDISPVGFQQIPESPPLAHIVSDNDKYGSQTRQRDICGIWHQKKINEQQHDSVDDTRDRGLPSIVDTCHCPCKCAGSRYSSEHRGDNIRYPLPYKLGIGIVFLSCHTICHHRGQKGLHGAQHGYGEGRRHQPHDCLVVEMRSCRLRHRKA